MRFFYLMAIFLLLSCEEPAKDIKQDQGKAGIEANAKTSQFSDPLGNAMDLDDFKGNPLVVNYWATWCVPCLKEFPSFVALRDSLQQEGVVFLFASPDKIEKIKEFKQNKGYDLELVHLNLSLDKLEIYALPSTFIYNSGGELYKRIDGARDWNTPEVIEMLKQVH